MFFNLFFLIPMNYLTYVYEWNARDLRKIIMALLKSGLVNEVKKVNYVQSFVLNNSKIEKNEQKIIMVKTDDEEKFKTFLSKNFPQIERININ